MSPVENEPILVILIFLYFPAEFFEFSFKPGANLGGHRGTCTGCLLRTSAF